MSDKTKFLVAKDYKEPNSVLIGAALPEQLDVVLTDTDGRYLLLFGVQNSSIVAYGVVNPNYLGKPIELEIAYDTNYEFDPTLAIWSYLVVSGSINSTTTHYAYPATYRASDNKVIPNDLNLVCSLVNAEMDGIWTLVLTVGEETITDEEATIVQTVLSCGLVLTPSELPVFTGTIVGNTLTLVSGEESEDGAAIFTGTVNDLGTAVTNGTGTITDEEGTVEITFTLTKNAE